MSKTQNNKVGSYNTDFNYILNLNLDSLDIFQSNGLKTHIHNRKHYSAEKYIDKSEDIITNPDYIGIKNNVDNTLQYIKYYDVPISIIVKQDNDRMYVSTMYTVTEKYINKQINKGKLFMTSRKGTLHSQKGT